MKTYEPKRSRAQLIKLIQELSQNCSNYYIFTGQYKLNHYIEKLYISGDVIYKVIREAMKSHRYPEAMFGICIKPKITPEPRFNTLEAGEIGKRMLV